MNGLALCCQWGQWIRLAFVRLAALSVDLRSVSVDSCPVVNSSHGFSITACISTACIRTTCPCTGRSRLCTRSHQLEKTHATPPKQIPRPGHICVESGSAEGFRHMLEIPGWRLSPRRCPRYALETFSLGGYVPQFSNTTEGAPPPPSPTDLESERD